jgi:hypothetical protein
VGPFWKRDGSRVGFFAEGGLLKMVRAEGGFNAETIFKGVSDPRGGCWFYDVILFASGYSEIYRINAAEKNKLERITALSGEEGAHRWPCFLSDGNRFVYTIRSGNPEDRGIWVGALDDPGFKARIEGMRFDSNALFSWTGHLIYLDEDQLMFREFDEKNLKVLGPPLKVVDKVGRSTLGSGAFSASDNGVLAWAGPMTQEGHLQWYMRNGEQAGDPLDHRPYEYVDFRLSPVGDVLLATRAHHAMGSVDIYSRRTAVASDWQRLIQKTPRNPINASPIWSARGDAVLFRSNPKAVIGFFTHKMRETGETLTSDQGELVLEGRDLKKEDNAVDATSLALTDWAGNGDILFSVPIGEYDFELWRLHRGDGSGKDKPNRIENQPRFGAQIHASLSPDGRFIAYSSNEGGEGRNAYEVYICDYPIGTTTPRSVSTLTNKAHGGFEPQWRKEGGNLCLYYLSEGLHVMRSPIDKNGNPVPPDLLFPTRTAPRVNALRTRYALARDGRFLVNDLSGPPVAPSIRVVFMDWRPRE